MKKRSKLLNATIVYFVAISLFVGVRIISGVVDTSMFSENVTSAIFGIVIQVCIMFCVPIFLFSILQRQKVKTTFGAFKFAPISLKGIGLAILIGVCCSILNYAIASFFGAIITMMGYEQSATSVYVLTDTSVGAFLLNVAIIALLPAVCEETAHRGLLLNGLSSLGLKKAIIYSSLLFGLMHLNVMQFFYATILGFLIALTVIISKSIIPAIIVHFLNNFFNVYFDFARANNWIGGNIPQALNNYFQNGNVIINFLVSFVVLVMVLFILVGLFYLLLRETRMKDLKVVFQQVKEIEADNTKDGKLSRDSFLRDLSILNSMLSQYYVDQPNKMVFTEAESRYQKPTIVEVIILGSTILLGASITIATFIWGLL